MWRNCVEELVENLAEIGGTWRNLWGETVWRSCVGNYVEELGGELGGIWRHLVELVERTCVEGL